MSLLYRLYHRGHVTKFEQAKVIEERLVLVGQSRRRARREAVRRLAGPPARGAVVAFSGLDGAGKSTQAELLAATLERIGVPAVVEWAKIGEDRWLSHLGQQAKRLLGPVHRLRVGGSALDRMNEEEVAVAGRQLRESSRTLTELWATIATVSNAVKQRRRELAHVVVGRVMICDRSTLDSLVHLRWRYGPDREFRAQAELLRRVSPRPLRAYFLDLPADVAQARKRQDQLGDLEAHASLYREELTRLGVVRLDATRSPESLAAEIGLDVWSALVRRGPRNTWLRRIGRALLGS